MLSELLKERSTLLSPDSLKLVPILTCFVKPKCSKDSNELIASRNGDINFNDLVDENIPFNFQNSYNPQTNECVPLEQPNISNYTYEISYHSDIKAPKSIKPPQICIMEESMEEDEFFNSTNNNRFNRPKRLSKRPARFGSTDNITKLKRGKKFSPLFKPSMVNPENGLDFLSLAAAELTDQFSGSSCHQCKNRKSKAFLVYCRSKSTKMDKNKHNNKSRPCQKKYCVQCLAKYYDYGDMSGFTGQTADTGWICPSCVGECNCSFHRKKQDK